MDVIKNIFFLGYAPPTDPFEWIPLIMGWISVLLPIIVFIVVLIIVLTPDPKSQKWKDKERLKQLLLKHSNRDHDNLIEVLLFNEDKEISNVCTKLIQDKSLDTAIRRILNEVYEENKRSNDDSTAINTTLQIVNTNAFNATQF